MQHKTRGIVLHSTGYNDKYSIIRIFTEEFGLIPYLMPKSKGKKTRTPKSIFYPLALLELEVEHHNLREIHRIKEARPFQQFTSLLCDPVKSSLCLFLAEFLSKIMKEVQADKLLFSYIAHSLEVLDLSDRKYSNFHLIFMIRISQFLGFYPDATEYTNGRRFFDMQNGVFKAHKPLHAHVLNPDESKAFYQLLRMDYDNMHLFRLSRGERREIIDRILEYYRLHLTNFGDIKSLDVLQELFNQ